jgi:hypothetical protein
MLEAGDEGVAFVGSGRGRGAVAVLKEWVGDGEEDLEIGAGLRGWAAFRADLLAEDDFVELAVGGWDPEGDLGGIEIAEGFLHVVGDEAFEVAVGLEGELDGEVGNDAERKAGLLHADDAGDEHGDGLGAGDEALAGLVLGADVDADFDQAAFLEFGFRDPRFILEIPLDEFAELVEDLGPGGGGGGRGFEFVDDGSGVMSGRIRPEQDWVASGDHGAVGWRAATARARASSLLAASFAALFLKSAALSWLRMAPALRDASARTARCIGLSTVK